MNCRSIQYINRVKLIYINIPLGKPQKDSTSFNYLKRTKKIIRTRQRPPSHLVFWNKDKIILLNNNIAFLVENWTSDGSKLNSILGINYLSCIPVKSLYFFFKKILDNSCYFSLDVIFKMQVISKNGTD